jgi:hypothetical protein
LVATTEPNRFVNFLMENSDIAFHPLMAVDGFPAPPRQPIRLIPSS